MPVRIGEQREKLFEFPALTRINTLVPELQQAAAGNEHVRLTARM